MVKITPKSNTSFFETHPDDPRFNEKVYTTSEGLRIIYFPDGTKLSGIKLRNGDILNPLTSKELIEAFEIEPPLFNKPG